MIIHSGQCGHFDCALRNNAGYCQVTACMNPRYQPSIENIKQAVEQYRQQHKTNADRIRAMSMEEIAELLDVWPNCNLCQAYYDTCDGPNKDESCKEKLIDWLKQEADNG